MNVPRRIPNRFHAPDVLAQAARRRFAAVVARGVSEAEDTERLERLEESLAIQERRFDEAMASNRSLAEEVVRLRQQLQQADGRLAAVEDAREALAGALEEREGHITELEARLLHLDVTDADAHRARARMLAHHSRVRARLVAQTEEIAGLRRTLALGHAARKQAEDELEACRADARRSARYLDRLEARLRDATAS
ncbi:MAG: hypothetical protein VX460_02095 [Planctomycetota bacterium]|nr:hypothetical protein [Planctomycetota bacterium]